MRVGQRKLVVALPSFLRNGFCPSTVPRLHIPQSFMLKLVCPPLLTNILLLTAYLGDRNPLGRRLCYAVLLVQIAPALSS